MTFARGWQEGGIGESVFNGYRVFVLKNGKVPEIDWWR